MRSRHTRNLLTTLFIPYTTLFIITFICVVSYFIISESRKIQKNSFAYIENNVINTLDNFDQMVSSLDSKSQNVMYSNLLKESFTQYNATQPSTPMEAYNSIQNTKMLRDFLVSIMGPNYPTDQIYIYGLSFGSYGFGLDNSSSYASVQDLPWYEDFMKSETDKFIFLDHDERLFSYYSYPEGRYFLTLVREYYSSLNVPQGIIEVKRSITPLIESIESYRIGYQEKFIVLDPEGRVVYPLSDISSAVSEYYSIINDASIAQEQLDLCLMKHAGDKYFLYQTSEYSHFTVAAIVENDVLRSPVRSYLVSMLLILLVICAAVIGLSYIISQQISKPLDQIYSRINSFQVGSESFTEAKFPEIKTNVLELNVLYQALIRMQAQTRMALEHELELQNSEMQSRILALQAQMNPHFLHNSLATIQAMAAEGMTDEIDTICQNISSILRYISSDSEQMVPLRDEIWHVEAFLECMKIRYENELSYSIVIPDEMTECQIPKLCLQLIVENAIKFTTRKRKPWNITIAGRITSSAWELEIIDNGPGFAPEKLEELQTKLQQIDETEVLPSLEINGMGLLNVYIRFKLLYKGKHIFRLDNNETEGANVTIGGPIQ